MSQRSLINPASPPPRDTPLPFFPSPAPNSFSRDVSASNTVLCEELLGKVIACVGRFTLHGYGAREAVYTLVVFLDVGVKN